MQDHTPDGASRQDTDPQTSLLESALAYWRRGWSIIPITSGSKKPACRSWQPYQNAHADESQIRRWFAKADGRGVAVIFGAVSGDLACRDFDVMASYDRWAADHPELAKTLPTVTTARGRHVYFRSNQSGIKTLDDGELRGGGYCLLPPSRHPDGPLYQWLVPLPDGPLPFVDDVRAAGFLGDGGDVTERTERTERTEGTEDYRGERKQLTNASLKKMIEAAILDSLPTQIGRRNRQVFELARALKAIPALADAPAEDLEPSVRCWHTLGVKGGVIGTEPFEETWIDFLQAWPKVKFPKGAEPMTKVFEMVKQAPMPRAAQRYEQGGLRLLVALCRELQRLSGDKPFFLACRTAGRLLGVKHVTAWRWLALLTHDRIVAEVEKGDRAHRRASRYRYLAD
jgi:hypothetical protein